MRSIKLTHPTRIVDAVSKTTKLDLYAYYEAVMDRMFPHLKDRPISIVRCPAGISGECFYQRHLPRRRILGLKNITIEGQTYFCLTKPQGVLNLVQFGAVEFHPWGCVYPGIAKPDRIVFDLDPAPELPFQRVIEAAFLLRSRLTAAGLIPYAKTTGGKGVHVVCAIKPEYDWSVIKSFCKKMAASLAAEDPENYTHSMAKSKRAGKIFIDYLRNDLHATSIAPYSLRAKPNLPMACPVRWSALRNVQHADQFNIRNLAARLRAADPWEDLAASAVSMTELLRA